LTPKAGTKKSKYIIMNFSRLNFHPLFSVLVRHMTFLDHWLQSWMSLIQERAADGVVVELGCGWGADTSQLCEAGLNVIGVDISMESLKLARRRVPAATFVCQDLRKGLPVEICSAVLASLSIHYFSWRETVEIVTSIRKVLLPGGVFVCRLNSTSDVFYGARRGMVLEKNFYVVNGARKRFFDREDITSLFQEWNVVSMHEKTTWRFGLPKRVWEVIAVS
jgi:SAM-dependent methyltransferase